MYTAVKRKIVISVCSLLLCFTLLVTSSYAWIMLSKAPEITGIQTQLGANGSLEMALLNEKTYVDPSLIRSSVGDSMANPDAVESNLSWGNVVDLSDPSYGLSKIVLIPSRLNVMENGQGGGVVRNSLLGTLRFGVDGRTEREDSESVSTAWSEDGFVYDAEKQDYGVRAIGSIAQYSVQQAALINARELVGVYQTTASEIIGSIWQSDGEELLNIFQQRYSTGADEFGDQSMAALRNAVEKMLEVYDYFDAALRQGIIGYAAATESDAETFRMLRDNIENASIPLSLMLESVSDSLPDGFIQWVSAVDSKRGELQQAAAACSSLIGASCTWEQLAPILDVLLDGNRVYLGEENLTSADAYVKAEEGATLSLTPDSGAFAEAADFCGNYSALFDHSDLTAVEVNTLSALDTPHLTKVRAMLDDLESPDAGAVITEVELEDIYGFAIDMAFRSNADTQLLLQTDAMLRVDGAEQLQGGGSNLSIHSEQLSVRQCVELMDAMRIGFMNSQNQLLAVAKANTSNYAESEEGVSAPLYLYDYEISDGVLLLGERRMEDPCITELADGMASVITAVVWLDGDYVTNSLVTSGEPYVEGKLNLQFSSNVILKPAQLDVETSE